MSAVPVIVEGGDGLRIGRSAAVTTFVIDRPATRNNLTLALVDALGAAVRGLRGDAGLRAIVLRGAGGRAFSAGFDIGAISRTAAVADDGSVDADRRLDAAFRALEEAPVPVIAAIEGHCIGGGFELALACDLRIVTRDARFRMPPAQLGWVYGLPNLARFVAAVGPGRARQLFLAAEAIGADTALDWGIAHEVVDDGEALTARVAALAGRISGLAPIALAGLKQGIGALAEAQVTPAALAGHADHRRRAFASDDLAEGRAAFLERREPRFTGR